MTRRFSRRMYDGCCLSTSDEGGRLAFFDLRGDSTTFDEGQSARLSKPSLFWDSPRKHAPSLTILY